MDFYELIEEDMLVVIGEYRSSRKLLGAFNFTFLPIFRKNLIKTNILGQYHYSTPFTKYSKSNHKEDKAN
jgi:hypothetical protein